MRARRLGAAAALAFTVSCSRPPVPVETAAPEPPQPERPSMPLPYDDERPVAAQPTRAPADPAPVIVLPPSRGVQLPEGETAASLEARYFAPGATAETRSSILQDLGSLATPAAGDSLGRIFQSEKRLETRGEALQVICDLPNDTCREQKFAALQRAVAPAMSQVIRLGALQSIADFEDPRVPGVLKALRNDRDKEVREMVTDLLKDLAP